MTIYNPINPSDQWYYAHGDQQLGPVDYAAIQQMAAAGNLRPDDLVWASHLPEWVPAGMLKGLFASAAASPIAAPPFSPSPYPQAPQQLSPYAASALGYESVGVNQPVYAGFWIRFVAVIIDGILVGITNFIIAVPIRLAVGIPLFAEPGGSATPTMRAVVGLLEFAIQITTGCLYEALMVSGPRQATLGKMALGLVVVDMSGERLTMGRAVGRYFAKWVSSITLGIGFLMAAFTQQKQGLHDIIASTLVIKGKRG